MSITQDMIVLSLAKIFKRSSVTGTMARPVASRRSRMRGLKAHMLVAIDVAAAAASIRSRLVHKACALARM